MAGEPDIRQVIAFPKVSSGSDPLTGRADPDAGRGPATSSASRLFRGKESFEPRSEMPDRRGSRFVLEALFLVGLAVAVTLAKLDALEIAGVMLLGWLVVAMLEWAAWRGEPHYGSGLPPRYYVPNVKLPPAQPLEQVRVGYPEAHRDEAPTWIASAALREEVLGEWPHATPLPVELPAEPEEEQGGPDAEPWAPVALPAVLGGEEARPGAGDGANGRRARAWRRALQPRPAGRPAAAPAVRPGRHGCTAGCRRPGSPRRGTSASGPGESAGVAVSRLG